MSDPSVDAVDTPARFDRSFTIDARFAGRMTAATFRFFVLTPGRIVRVALTSVIFAVFCSLPVEPVGVATIGVFILVLLAISALYAVSFLIAFFPARKQIGDRLPAGSEYSIAMGEDSMQVKDSLVTTDVSYQFYRSLRASGKVIALMPRRGRRATILPIELFTAESLGWLGSRLKADASRRR